LEGCECIHGPNYEEKITKTNTLIMIIMRDNECNKETG